MKKEKITAEAIKKAISEGFSTYQKESGFGCGRVYVCVGRYNVGNESNPAVKQENKRRISAIRSAIAKAACSLGVSYKAKGYPSQNSLYIGYDNCSGIALGQGTAIVANLKAIGIPAYRDEAED